MMLYTCLSQSKRPRSTIYLRGSILTSTITLNASELYVKNEGHILHCTSKLRSMKMAKSAFETTHSLMMYQESTSTSARLQDMTKFQPLFHTTQFLLHPTWIKHLYLMTTSILCLYSSVLKACKNHQILSIPRLNLTRHFYFNRLPRLWNSLLHSITDISQPISSVKSDIQAYFWDNFIANFNPGNSYTFHYSYSKCMSLPVSFNL